MKLNSWLMNQIKFAHSYLCWPGLKGFSAVQTIWRACAKELTSSLSGHLTIWMLTPLVLACSD
jgi:hypothetical protein